MQPEIDPIESALIALKNGLPILVVDDFTRENEGDVILAAEHASPANINFCVTQARGLVCLAIEDDIAKRLQLRPMRTNHQDPFHTAFLDSIDAAPKWGTTTGISAGDRSITARLVTDPNVGPADFVKPGHLFPLLAKKGGVLTRRGHTEASVDLCKMAGLSGAAIICEVMSEDGTMMRDPELRNFAQAHSMPYISVEQLVAYRLNHASRSTDQNHSADIKTSGSCTCFSTAQLPTQHGDFVVRAFRNSVSQQEHLVLSLTERPDVNPIIRIHSECLTGDVLGSLRCDCGEQLTRSLEIIQERGHGHLVYLKNHEGRGIGLANKIAAYALQDNGLDTFEANHELGFSADARDYSDAVEILRSLNLEFFELLTANPEKVDALQKAGFTFQVNPIRVEPNPANQQYLSDKQVYFKNLLKLQP